MDDAGEQETGAADSEGDERRQLQELPHFAGHVCSFRLGVAGFRYITRSVKGGRFIPAKADLETRSESACPGTGFRGAGGHSWENEMPSVVRTARVS